MLRYAAATPHEKGAAEALKTYLETMFPGLSKQQDPDLLEAKRMLAEEAKKVFVVRKIQTSAAAHVERMQEHVPEVAGLAWSLRREEEKKEAATHSRLQRLKRRGG